MSNPVLASQRLQQRNNQHLIHSEESLAAGTSNITSEIDPTTELEAAHALSGVDTKRQNSTTASPGTIQGVDVASNVSSQHNSISISKLFPQERLTDLKDLIGETDGQAIPQDLQKLIVEVLNEIETWLNRAAAPMTFEAQAALSNTAHNGRIRDDLWNRFSGKDEKFLLPSYHTLLRSATSNDALSNEKQQMLLNLLRESEEFVKEPGNATTDKIHQDELYLLHEICDSYIALHSVETAIRLISRAIDEQSRKQVLRVPFEDKDMVKQVERLNNQGVDLLERYERFGNITDLGRAIELLEAVASTPLGTAGRLGFLTNLGISYQCRFRRFGEAKDIDLAIERQREAVIYTPYDNADRPGLLSNLGDSYRCRFQRFGEVEDIDLAIKRLREAVASTPLGSAERPERLNNLGISYRYRFERFWEVKDIESAIEQQRKAVSSTPLHSARRPALLNNLGGSYLRRFGRFGEAKDIDSAILLQREAVASTPLDSPHRPGFLANLGSSYNGRFGLSGKAEDIDLAIKWQHKAVASTPLDSAIRPGYLNNLGDSYRRRFEWFGKVKDVDSAIEQQLEAVASAPRDSTSRSGFLISLGNSYLRRFQWFRDVKDIDLAIERQLEAVTHTAVDSAERPGRLNSLGLSYLRRFEQFAELKDIHFSIERQLEAVASSPLDSADRPGYLDNLGTSYRHLFERSRDVKDIDFAIERQLEAIMSPTLDSTRRPECLNSLGKSYTCRFDQLREAKDIDTAIKWQLEAAASISPDSTYQPDFLNNLGYSYMRRFGLTQESTDFHESVSNFRLSSLSRNGLPSSRINGALAWAGISHLQDLTSASEAYDHAISLLPQVTWIGLDAIAQLNKLDSGIQSLGCDAAACRIALAQAECHDEQSHLGRAIELLDQGRSILWSQTSNFKRDLEDLRKVDKNLACKLDHLGKVLGQGCFRNANDTLSEADAQLYRRSAERWEDLVHDIRKIPDFQHFLLPPPISTLRTAAADSPVVIINSSIHRCDALIIPPQGDLVLVPLPNITSAELKALTNEQEEFASRKSKSVYIPSSDDTASETLERVLNETWLLVGEPIVQKFKELGLGVSSKCRVWWCLTGSLSFLPIHASFPPNEPAMGMMDFAVSSYTPTISALLRAQQPKKRPTFRMLAVGQSMAPGKTQLPGVTEEIVFISDLLGAEAKILQESNATVDEVAASLPTCSWVHFACHGVQDPDQPMDSGLVMWDGHHLTLSHLAQSSLGSAEFAFLSCCESATGSKQFPNEAVHLAAGLQFIGFRGVIGTMWSVGDKDALMVAKHVYQELFKDGTDRASASEAPFALHQAVHHLRNHVPLVRWVPFIHFGL